MLRHIDMGKNGYKMVCIALNVSAQIISWIYVSTGSVSLEYAYMSYGEYVADAQ
jgi:hypothetical protein